MKMGDIIFKTIKEHVHHFRLLLVTLLVSPLFMLVYYIIAETPTANYEVAVISDDLGIFDKRADKTVNYVDSVAGYISYFNENIHVHEGLSKQRAMQGLYSKKWDVVIEFPNNFSATLEGLKYSSEFKIPVHFVGDVSGNTYLNCAVWLYQAIESFVEQETNIRGPVVFSEEGIGPYSTYSQFDLQMGRLLIFALIITMLPAFISIIRDKEQKTMVRLRMSCLRNHEYLLGMGLVQLMISLVSLGFALLVAIQLGFRYHGKLLEILFIGFITALSVIAFIFMIVSLGLSRKKGFIVTGIAMILFALFSGVLVPIDAPSLFSLGDYPVHANAIFSTSFAVSALSKFLLHDTGTFEMISDMTGLVVVTLIYIFFGFYFYRKRLRYFQS